LVKEHYGVDIGSSAVRDVTLEHARKALRNEEKRPKVKKLKSCGKEEIIAQIDGSFLPMVRIKEGEGDKRKLREGYWAEARLAVARGKGEAQSWYGVSFRSVEEAGEMWARTVQAAGWGADSKIHAVGDGSVWIFDQSKKQFGKQGTFLLDFYHLSEYLGSVAKEKLEEGERKPWLVEQQKLLKNNEFNRVLESLKVHIDDKNPDCAAFEAYRYLDNRKDQVDYKGALEKELPIGSGLVESGHRSVLQGRLKIAGAFWLPENAESMAQLLVLKQNGEWDDYWKQEAIKLAA
jgi:hypothetical protein